MSLVCCFGCLSLCGCKNVVARRLVFFPPKPMYCLETKEEKDGRERQIMWLIDEQGQKILPYSSRNFSVQFLPTPRGKKICTMFINYPNSPRTILFSHGNATDIGCMRDHLLDMAMRLKLSIICYDYEGYGLSGGKSSVESTLLAAEVVYEHMTTKMGLKPSQIVLYGQSLGSGPTAHLAAKHHVAGVVFHAGIMSGLRVLREQPKTRFFDIFANVDLVRHCQAPVFVIHGRADEEIPIHHGEGLYDAAPVKYEPWYPEGAGHNNVEMMYRNEFFDRMAAFVQYLEKGGGVAVAPAASPKASSSA